MKYIYKRKNGYAIQKVINKKVYSFGLYDTLEEAQYYRDYFIEHDWPMTKRLEFSKRKNKNKKEPKNIYKAYGGVYEIRKEINHKKYSFGTYPTLEEAIKARDYFVKNGWKIYERLIFSTPQYIVKRNGKYEIRKVINGKLEHFGVFNSLEDAKDEVTFLKKCGWDYDNMESIDDTVNDKPMFLDGVHFKSFFERKAERNDLYLVLNGGLR